MRNDPGPKKVWWLPFLIVLLLLACMFALRGAGGITPFHYTLF